MEDTHITQATCQLEMPVPGHHHRLHGHDAALALAHDDEAKDDPPRLLALLLLAFPPRNPEHLLEIAFLNDRRVRLARHAVSDRLGMVVIPIDVLCPFNGLEADDRSDRSLKTTYTSFTCVASGDVQQRRLRNSDVLFLEPVRANLLGQEESARNVQLLIISVS